MKPTNLQEFTFFSYQTLYETVLSNQTLQMVALIFDVTSSRSQCIFVCEFEHLILRLFCERSIIPNFQTIITQNFVSIQCRQIPVFSEYLKNKNNDIFGDLKNIRSSQSDLEKIYWHYTGTDCWADLIIQSSYNYIISHDLF